MKRILTFPVAIVLFGFLAWTLPAKAAASLEGWEAPNPAFWTFESGVLVGQNNPQKDGNVLYTQKAYSNFVFTAEVRWTGEIDSGVMFRRPELQLQIGVSRSLKRDMTGSYYTGGKDAYPESGRALEADKVLKAGEWNHFKLEANGDQFTCWINGRKVSQYSDPKYSTPGPIGLQIHAGLPMKVEFRNIEVKSTSF